MPTMLDWVVLHPRGLDMLGYIPGFVSEDDPRPVKEQFQTAYAHGGGWNPMQGWEVVDDRIKKIKYPGDPALEPVAMADCREELICVYPHAWVGIFQKDGSFEIARLD